MPRITAKYIKDFVDDNLKRLEIDWHVTEVYRTHYRPLDYEGGAAYISIFIENNIDNRLTTFINCFYPMYLIQQYIDGIKWGKYELYLKFGSNPFLSNIELDIRKL